MVDKFSREDVKAIYNKLGDELSKDIFINRLLYSITEDKKYLWDVIMQTTEARLLKERLQQKGKKAIFGAATLGKQIFQYYTDSDFVCFIDNKCGETPGTYEGLPLMNLRSFIDLQKKEEVDTVVVASFTRHEEIVAELKSVGFKEENIVNAGQLTEQMSLRQYFDLPQLKDKKFEKEVFIDGGCFDGSTSIAFEKWSESKENKIYVFEPDVENLNKIKKRLCTSNCEIEMIEKGLWRSSTKLKFDQRGTAGSLINEDGNVWTSVTSIDDTIHDKVTFIKMDIEGAEYAALEGGAYTIAKYKPRLAISIYHQPEDIMRLPHLILSENPAYIFYLRHYSIGPDETVLYAIER